jgi:hypothetical protein
VLSDTRTAGKWFLWMHPSKKKSADLGPVAAFLYGTHMSRTTTRLRRRTFPTLPGTSAGAFLNRAQKPHLAEKYDGVIFSGPAPVKGPASVELSWGLLCLQRL